MSPRIIYSFVVDERPIFAFQAWHLARSIMLHCAAAAADIHVQITPGVSRMAREAFDALGCRVHALEKFGDGRWCNKLAQLPNLLDEPCDRIVLLDTDMIAVADLRPFLTGDAVHAKPVDTPSPSLAALAAIFAAAGHAPPPTIATDEPGGQTCHGNCNGGFYDIPRPLAERLSDSWRKWALWLLADTAVLNAENKTAHVDQVSMALALNIDRIPFSPAPSNINYFIHYKAERSYLDCNRPIALLHYHNAALSVTGYLEPPIPLTQDEKLAVERANRQIRDGFHNGLFRNFRYATHPKRGSGLGSRGENAARKRAMLKANGIERFASILDVGCGDLEVMAPLDLNSYLGIDPSETAIGIARTKRPDWSFQVLTGQDLPAAEAVLCLEVLIHQETPRAYFDLIALLARHTSKALFVSGYENKSNPTHMVFFHEPLSRSLAASGRFRSIAPIGSHSDVVVYRCDV